MQVKIFESTDMASGLKLVKETLGADALILSTRTIRSGKLGILGKPVLEITAAVDAPWPEANQQQPPAAKPRNKSFTQWADDTILPRKSQPGQAITYDSQFRIQKEPEDTGSLRRGKRDEAETPAMARTTSEQTNKIRPSALPDQSPISRQMVGSSRETHPEMHNELDELKEMVKKLGLEMSRIKTRAGVCWGLIP